MSSKNLLLVFVKNPELGKVKTRLAKDIGDEKALDVYKKLLLKTREVCESVDATKWIYYNESTEANNDWFNVEYPQFLQKEGDLGEKMLSAFGDGFRSGFDRIVIIGSDCYDISAEIINEAFEKLDRNDVSLGPALDGGYYLLGLKALYKAFFVNKIWSTENVFLDTVEDIYNLQLRHHLLPTLNDIDTLNDLQKVNPQLLEN